MFDNLLITSFLKAYRTQKQDRGIVPKNRTRKLSIVPKNRTTLILSYPKTGLIVPKNRTSYPKTGLHFFYCTQKQDLKKYYYLAATKVKHKESSMENLINSVARIENHFIFNAQYQLTAREQKVILYLVAKIDPTGKQFGLQIVPIKELKELIMSKRSGSFYDEMEEFAKRIFEKKIVFDSEVAYKNKKKKMSGRIRWFSSIIPAYNDEGETCLKFRFAQELEPFLLQLKEYTQIDYKQTIPLGSGFSVRMYQVFRAHRDKMAKHQKRSKLLYEIDQLKKVLGVEDKYKDWRKFKERVVSVIEKEINEHTDIRIQTNLIRKGRKVIALEYEIWDKRTKGEKSNTKAFSSLQFEQLTFAQTKAYDNLVAYQITQEIALEMLSRVGGSEIAGFEDWYFEAVVSIFEAKTKQVDDAAKAGTLVNWFLKKKIFEQGDHFAKVMENLQARKKKQQKEQPTAWDNRLLAKTMTSAEFTTAFKSKKQ